MTKESMYYIEAHGYKPDNHEKKTNGSNGKASTSKPNGSNESTGQPAAVPASCGNCGMKNHTTSEVSIKDPSSPHQCSEAHGEGEVELACGCMMAVVAGSKSPDEAVKQWKTR